MACAALHSPRDAPEGGCTVQNLSAAGGEELNVPDLALGTLCLNGKRCSEPYEEAWKAMRQGLPSVRREADAGGPRTNRKSLFPTA